MQSPVYKLLVAVSDAENKPKGIFGLARRLISFKHGSNVPLQIGCIAMSSTHTKKVTIKSIAEALGISFSTVSKSLNGSPGINSETRALVVSKAREMGYSPNLFARGLRTNSIKSIAVIFNDIENPVLTYIFKTISVAMAKHGYTTQICDSQFDAEAERVSIQAAISRMTDYIIIAPATTDSSNLDLLIASDSNVIVFDRAHHGANCHFIDVDYAYGGYVAACELLSKGHRDILIVSEPLDYPYSSYYTEGIRKAFDEYGIPFRPEYQRFVHSSMENTCSIMLSLWDYGKHAFKLPFSAVMCFGDNFALGVYKAAAQLGLSVPGDLSVVGFDDNDICGFTTPPLSSVHLPREWMAKTCLDILEADLINEEPAGYSFSLSPHLMARGSVRAVY